MINKASGKRAFAVSGRANNSRNVGAFYVNTSYSLSTSNSTIGRQLSYSFIKPHCNPRKPRLSPEYQAIPTSVGSASESSGEL